MPINGKLSVVQSRDFHPDHNTFVEQKIKEFAEKMNYPLDHSWAEAYAGEVITLVELQAYRADIETRRQSLLAEHAACQRQLDAIGSQRLIPGQHVLIHAVDQRPV